MIPGLIYLRNIPLITSFHRNDAVNYQRMFRYSFRYLLVFLSNHPGVCFTQSGSGWITRLTFQWARQKQNRTGDPSAAASGSQEGSVLPADTAGAGKGREGRDPPHSRGVGSLGDGQRCAPPPYERAPRFLSLPPSRRATLKGACDPVVIEAFLFVGQTLPPW